MDAKELLMDVVKRNASDVFIVAGSPCAVKIHGKIQKYMLLPIKMILINLLEMETMIFHFQFLELVDFV